MVQRLVVLCERDDVQRVEFGELVLSGRVELLIRDVRRRERVLDVLRGQAATPTSTAAAARVTATATAACVASAATAGPSFPTIPPAAPVVAALAYWEHCGACECAEA